MLRKSLLKQMIMSLSAIGVILTVAVGSALAQGNTPTGTIYYRVGINTMTFNAIKADGTGLTQNLLPNLGLEEINFIAFPCNHRQGSNAVHDRWWVALLQTGTYDERHRTDGTIQYNFPHYDLFAVRSNPQNRSQLVKVQLTDLYGIARMGSVPCWSNDSNESLLSSFVAVGGMDIRGAYQEVTNPDGSVKTVIDQALEQICTVRLPLTASEITAGWQANNFVPAGPDSMTPAELEAILWPDLDMFMLSLRTQPQGSYSPDGALYVKPDPKYLTTVNRLVIANASMPYLNDPVRVLWDGNTAAPRLMDRAKWSPDGQTIAFIDQANAVWGDLWIQAASGASPPKRLLARSVKGTTTIEYTDPIWSPDSKFLVVRKTETRNGNLWGDWLTRVSVSDGKAKVLVSISATVTATLRWVPDN